MKDLLYSIVVPVYNSQASLGTLVERVAKVMEGASLRFELVLVDDGSRDDSFQEIQRLSRTQPWIRGFRLSRNFGHQAAVTIGLQKALGDVVAVIDDDLQDPPEVLPVFFEGLRGRHDVVYGVRRKRKEGLLKRTLFSGFYRVMKALADIDIPQDAGDFCAMRRCVVDAMLQMPEAHPFLRGIRAWAGFRQTGIAYERDARFQGESGYSLGKYLELALTGILMFSRAPLRLATLFGFITSFSSFGYGFYMLTRWLIKPFDVPGYLSLFMVTTLLGGVQLIAIGTIGHYMGFLIENNRRWPVAFVAETTGEGEP